jgi:hypothetical protein
VANSNQNVTTAALHIDEVWVDGVIRALEFDLKIAPFVDRTWAFVGHGDVYHKTRLPNIETQTKSAGSALNATAYTDTEQTITINVNTACAIKHENIAEVLSRNDVKGEMTKNMGYALGRSVDVLLAALAQSFSQTVGTLGVELTYDNLLRAVQYLEDAGYDMGRDVGWFVSPAQKAGFMKMDTFINNQYRGDQNMLKASEKGVIGMFQGAPVSVTQLVRAPAAGQHDNFLLHKESVALIMAQEPKTYLETIALDTADVVVSAQIFGYSEIDRYSEAPGNVTATDEGAVWLKGV